MNNPSDKEQTGHNRQRGFAPTLKLRAALCAYFQTVLSDGHSQTFRMQTAASTYTARSASAGFTILIAVLTASIVVAIGLSVLSLSSRQVALSGVEHSSEIAFQAANAGLECVRFHDISTTHGNTFDVPNGGASVNCFGTSASNENGSAESGDEQLFELTWGDGDFCSAVSVYKFYSESGSVPVEIDGVSYRANECPAGVECTIIKARGYNSPCNLTGVQGTVERELTAVY